MTQIDFKHTPVLLEECIRNLNIKPNGVYVDGTLGGGGHSMEICKHLSKEGVLIGIDRDEDALEATAGRLESFPCKKIFVHANYGDIKDVLLNLQNTNQICEKTVDGVLLDLGVSSFQLDNRQRGFSYMQAAPLDMRMDQSDSLTAHDVVNGYSQRELADIIYRYGEERWAKRISEFIVKTRENGSIDTTSDLVDIIKAAIPAGARRNGPHPAKRTFQAIRIEVNNELGQLEKALEDFCDVMKAGGRMCVISFHSLEDRIVKEIISKRANPCTCPRDFPVCVCGKTPDVKKISGKPILPTKGEVDANPRARSAKLRVCKKI